MKYSNMLYRIKGSREKCIINVDYMYYSWPVKDTLFYFVDIFLLMRSRGTQKTLAFVACKPEDIETLEKTCHFRCGR